MRQVSRQVLVYAALLGVGGCGSSAVPVGVAAGVQRLHRTDCPLERMRIVEERGEGFDTLYVIEACGVNLEVQQGLALPKKRSELTEIAPEEASELSRPSDSRVPNTTVEIVRRKAQDWCVLGGPGSRAPDAIAFYSATPAEHAECQRRVASSITPLGVERNRGTGSEELWFSMGSYSFKATPMLATPSCEKLTLTDTPEACRCRGGDAGHCEALSRARQAELPGDRAPVASLESEHAPVEAGARRRVYGHLDAGPGYLHYERGPAVYDGLAFHFGGIGSLALDESIMAGLGVGVETGLTAKATTDPRGSEGAVVVVPGETELRPMVLYPWAVFTLYPNPPLGLLVEAAAGVAALRRGPELEFEGGSLLSVAVGYDDPRSLFGLRLRGLYISAAQSETFGASLLLGFHSR